MSVMSTPAATIRLSVGIVMALATWASPRVLAHPSLISANPVPPTLQPPAGEQMVFKLTAKGTQIYVCQATIDQPQRFEWSFKAPKATLLDQQKIIGDHYAGPTWAGDDGSKIVGQVKAKVKAPAADAIPWLLLEVKSRAGQGMFTPVNWVQRLNTVGGQAPTGGCDRAHQNQERSVGYSADYYFYGTGNSGGYSR
jgi:Protein of unknown function (DUF3455)